MRSWNLIVDVEEPGLFYNKFKHVDLVVGLGVDKRVVKLYLDSEEIWDKSLIFCFESCLHLIRDIKFLLQLRAWYDLNPYIILKIHTGIKASRSVNHDVWKLKIKQSIRLQFLNRNLIFNSFILCFQLWVIVIFAYFLLALVVVEAAEVGLIHFFLFGNDEVGLSFEFVFGYGIGVYVGFWSGFRD